MSNDGRQIILLVEDNDDDVFLTEQMFKAARISIPLFVVRDGQEAIDYLCGTGNYADRTQFPFPGLVLLDLKLPYYSGLEILAIMREKGWLAQTTVAVLTSSNEPSDLKKAYELGANTYLVKPPTPQMLFDVAKAFKLDWLQPR